MSVKLLTEHHLQFLSLKGDCTGFSESTFVKMPHCWKSHVVAHILPSSYNNFCHEVSGSLRLLTGIVSFLVHKLIDWCVVVDVCLVDPNVRPVLYTLGEPCACDISRQTALGSEELCGRRNCNTRK